MEEEGSEIIEMDDRFSRLPDEVRELILGYLPITDAVITGLLSQKWRDSWKKVVQLNIVFDEDFEHEISTDRYCRLVGKIFLSHVGNLHKCVMRPLWDDYGDDMKGWEYLEGDMKIWLQLLSRKGIEDLTIDLRKRDDAPAPPEFGNENYIKNFVLPHSIFCCLGLSRLVLGRFLIKSSVALRGFPNLVKLELIETTIRGDSLEKIISCSPLETLIIKDCVSHYGHTAISSRSLNNLKIVQTIDESFPFILKFTPNLRVGSFIVDADDNAICWSRSSLYIFEHIPKIEELNFDIRLLMMHRDIFPTEFPKSLVHLKTATFNGMEISRNIDLLFLFCLLRSSPNLQNLTINFGANDVGYSADSIFETLTATGILDGDGIKIIKASITTLSIVYDWPDAGEIIEGHIAVINRLVLCCPDLEKVFIKSPPSFTAYADRQLKNALPKLGQSSSKLKIISYKI